MLNLQIAERNNNKISFKSESINQKITENCSDADLYSIVNTPDEFFKKNAYNKEAQKFVNAPIRKVEKRTGQAIPVADTLLTAALTQGSFGDKIMAGVGRAGFWVIFGGITNKLSKKLNENETYRNYTREHPATASLVGSVAVSSVGILGCMAVKTVAKKGFNKLVKKYEPLKNFINSIHNDLNQLPLGKKISAFADKNRKYTALAGVIGLVGVTGLIVNRLVSLARIKKNADKNEAQYKEIRFDASKELNNRLLTAQAQTSAE